MKHGDKAKAKSAKASSKSSGKKGSTEAGSKAGGSKKDGGAKAVPKGKGAAPQAVPQSAGKGVPAAGKGGSARGNPSPPAGSFSNALIGNAFKRAVKKYPNAFRRLTD